MDSIEIKDKKIKVKNWQDALIKTYKYLNTINKQKIYSLVWNKNFLVKSKKENVKQPFVLYSKNYSDIYLETKLTNAKIVLEIKEVLFEFNILPSEVKIVSKEDVGKVLKLNEIENKDFPLFIKLNDKIKKVNNVNEFFIKTLDIFKEINESKFVSFIKGNKYSKTNNSNRHIQIEYSDYKYNLNNPFKFKLLNHEKEYIYFETERNLANYKNVISKLLEKYNIDKDDFKLYID